MKASGFSLIELVVALGLMLVVTAAIFDLVAQSRRSFDTEPDAVDRQQRIRVAVDALQHDLLMASAVMPYRAAAASPDPPGSFKDDVVTIVSEQAAQADTVRTYPCGATHVRLSAADARGGSGWRRSGRRWPYDVVVRLLRDSGRVG